MKAVIHTLQSHVQYASLLKLQAVFMLTSLFLVLGQIEVQFLRYQYVKACLLGIYNATLAFTDIITHSRHRHEWMKVSKIHFFPHDSMHEAKFQGFRFCKGKAFFVTHLGSDAAAIVYNQNNKKSC